MQKWFSFNMMMQVGLVAFTLGGFFLTALKMPQYGLISNLISEIFWFYASWKAWKEAKQYGVLITTAVITCVVLFGIVNYWFL